MRTKTHLLNEYKRHPRVQPTGDIRRIWSQDTNELVGAAKVDGRRDAKIKTLHQFQRNTLYFESLSLHYLKEVSPWPGNVEGLWNKNFEKYQNLHKTSFVMNFWRYGHHQHGLFKSSNQPEFSHF